MDMANVMGLTLIFAQIGARRIFVIVFFVARFRVVIQSRRAHSKAGSLVLASPDAASG
jgi:hypothetical protein